MYGKLLPPSPPPPPPRRYEPITTRVFVYNISHGLYSVFNPVTSLTFETNIFQLVSWVYNSDFFQISNFTENIWHRNFLNFFFRAITFTRMHFQNGRFLPRKGLYRLRSSHACNSHCIGITSLRLMFGPVCSECKWLRKHDRPISDWGVFALTSWRCWWILLRNVRCTCVAVHGEGKLAVSRLYSTVVESFGQYSSWYVSVLSETLHVYISKSF